MAYVKPKALLDKQAATRARLLTHTLELIARRGLHDSSIINGVAKRARVSVGLVYKHFANVDEMVAQALAIATQRDLKRVRDTAGIGGVTSNATALGLALMVIYSLHASSRMRATLAADPNWREAMQTVLTAQISHAVNTTTPKQARLAAAAALGAILAAVDYGERSKNNALTATLFVLRGCDLPTSAVTSAMITVSKVRYSLEDAS